MSNFCAPTFHPKTGKIEHASWLDDYFGHHEYGVRFPSDGVVYKSYDCERVLPKAMAEIERLRAKTEWRPIETAPKDGTHFIAYEQVGDMYRAAYHREGYLCAFCGQYVTQTPEPTHWMPLPDAPEGE